MFWVKRAFLCAIFVLNYFHLGIGLCTWDTCADTSDPTITYVHIVPHTHDDMGWKKTADDYYTGAHPLETQLAGVFYPGVQYVINTVLDELDMDPTKKFSYCETGFLTRWLEDASRTPVEIERLKKFVINGQLEFIGGGWVQPDEATTHYVDLIDAYTLGLRKLQSALGLNCTRPKLAWQIDPFGHSREHANLAVMMGYEGIFFARETYLEHAMRIQEKRLEFEWQTSDDFANKIFTGVFYNHYDYPFGFCYDVSCTNSNPIIDNPELIGYNLDQILTDFKNVVTTRSQAFVHNQLLILMGSDFHYGNANMWFTNLDKLIYYMNQLTSQTKIQLFYSTPTCYYQAIKNATTNWTNKTTDFYPYAFTSFLRGEHSYWSGYFTSKPAFKGLVRQSSAFLQLVRKLNALANLNSVNESNSQEQKLERAISLSQHHDAITGTSKDYVTQDYIARIYSGWDDAEVVLNNALNRLSQIGRANSASFPQQKVCRAINETDCLDEIGILSQVAVTVYNSHIQLQKTLIRLPLYKNISSVTIIDSEGNSVTSQVIRTPNNTALTGDPQLMNNDGRQAKLEINFLADVNPLGFRTYFVDLNGDSNDDSNIQPTGPTQAYTIIQNEFIMLHFDATGRLVIYHDLETDKKYSMTQDFLYYLGYGTNGGDSNVNQSSGAYVMRPASEEPISIAYIFNISMEVVNTSLSMEVRQHFSNWASQTIRLVKGKRYAEFEWTIGPIPDIFYEPFSSKEIITRYTVTNITNNGTFYTDSNGRQLIKRIQNYAPDYTYNNTEPVSANYYPVNSRIIVSDPNQALVVLTDRSEGGTSLQNGTIELLVHRRTYYDDHFGVNEPLNEERDGRGLVVRGRHWVFLAPPENLAMRHRTLALDMFNTPVVAFSKYDNYKTYDQNYITQYSGICTNLTKNINLLTLKQIDPSTLLIRLENIFQTNEDPMLSVNQTVNIQDILPMFSIQNVQEMKLAANDYVTSQVSTNVTIQPMEIRTFLLTVSRLFNVSCNTEPPSRSSTPAPSSGTTYSTQTTTASSTTTGTPGTGTSPNTTTQSPTGTGTSTTGSSAATINGQTTASTINQNNHTTNTFPPPPVNTTSSSSGTPTTTNTNSTTTKKTPNNNTTTTTTTTTPATTANLGQQKDPTSLTIIIVTCWIGLFMRKLF